jgi:hypothetical protein
VPTRAHAGPHSACAATWRTRQPLRPPPPRAARIQPPNPPDGHLVELVLRSPTGPAALGAGSADLSCPGFSSGFAKLPALERLLLEGADIGSTAELVAAALEPSRTISWLGLRRLGLTGSLACGLLLSRVTVLDVSGNQLRVRVRARGGLACGGRGAAGGGCTMQAHRPTRLHPPVCTQPSHHPSGLPTRHPAGLGAPSSAPSQGGPPNSSLPLPTPPPSQSPTHPKGNLPSCFTESTDLLQLYIGANALSGGMPEIAGDAAVRAAAGTKTA